MKKVFLSSCFVIWVVLATPIGPTLSAEKEGRQVAMKKLFPLVVDDYRAEKKDESYNRNTSYRYMDGAAELYRAYAFKLLLVRKYVKVDHPSILVELFDMGTSEDAFGIFSYQTEDEEVGVGQGSDYGGGLLRFWKGKYFANVYAERDTPSMRNDILKIGRAIAGNIKQEGKKPSLIRLLPSEGLSERSIRFFYLHQVLNHHYFISHQNILQLGERTKGILATYLQPQVKEKTYLLIIQYPTKMVAAKAFKNFVKAYMPDASTLGTIKTENGKWTSAKNSDQYILIAFDAISEQKAEELIRTTLRRLEEK